MVYKNETKVRKNINGTGENAHNTLAKPSGVKLKGSTRSSIYPAAAERSDNDDNYVKRRSVTRSRSAQCKTPQRGSQRAPSGPDKLRMSPKWDPRKQRHISEGNEDDLTSV